MGFKKYMRNLDIVLIILILLLFSIGLGAIRTATNIENFVAGSSSTFISKQIIAFILGTIAIIIIMLLDYQILGQYWVVIYILSILLLIVVFIPGIGIVMKGTRGWISLGFMDIQTSEIAKIGFIISFAKLLEKRKEKLDKLFDIILLIIFLIIPVVLIIQQPDLGQALVFVFIAIGMVFVAGLNMKYVYSAFGAFIIGFPILWNFVMHDYQKDRIITLFNPANDPLGDGYHALQSMATVGSGGVFGKGFSAESTMTKLNFLPAQWTDFIFSVIAETTGFIGSSIVVIIFGLFLYRLILDAREAKDEFGTLIVIGIFFMFLFQILENIGMTIGVMPITGITLPFLSYGGSSLITNLIAIGLVLNVYMRRHQISF